MTVIQPGAGGFLDDTIQRVRDWDASRPRSVQAEVGWSEAGGCRSAIGYRLSGTWASDETDGWAATRGTAIHKLMEEVMDGVPGMRTELETRYRGILGHADLVQITKDAVRDWKTTKLANSLLWQRDPDVLRQKRIQGHGYAAGLIDDGTLPEDCCVALVVIPVDGGYDDWWMWEEPFDRALADEGADRVEWVAAQLAAGEPLPKDKHLSFCTSWCPFVSLCRPERDDEQGSEITDPDVAAAIRGYGEVTAEISGLYKIKDAFAGQIRGVTGTTPDGWRVSMTKPGEKKLVLDEEWVRADYAARGELVPEVLVPGAAPKLNVRKLRKAAPK